MAELGRLLPDITVSPPGAVCERYIEILASTECLTLTARRARRREPSGLSHDPIVWSAARGANVIDADGNRYVDLTSGFGAAAVGHGHPKVVEAIKLQAGKLLHALGDVHPSETKVQLLERMAQLAPFEHARVILGLNGSDAIEAALKTAALATRRPGVLAFDGGYHGLSYGALATCGYKESFRSCFAQQLGRHVVLAPYPHRTTSDRNSCTNRAIQAVESCWDRARLPIGAVLVEPIQGRGGVVQPPEGFLAELDRLCKEREALFVVDEIYTGLGRCGSWWRCEDEGVEPDLICAGKALGGGLPISACIGKAEVMAAWGGPGQEALHTATFFGHPVCCAAALATLDVIDKEKLCQRAEKLGDKLLSLLRESCGSSPSVVEVRGAGMLIGIELKNQAHAVAIVRRLLEKGYLTLPAGVNNDVISITPPLTIAPELIEGFVEALDEALFDVASL
ncbi:MAG: aminotransferase class III-fold pyridoxal phosphate-dependent enzyme [Deltaproteobacteria bacterium]|nr:aminotransferase class III-fold pyridoxal phosphate-dependent enzyme [Deltaproteobacteria bacterium]